MDDVLPVSKCVVLSHLVMLPESENSGYFTISSNDLTYPPSSLPLLWIPVGITTKAWKCILAACMTSYFRFVLYMSCPRPGIGLFSKQPCFSLVG